jgi:uncharacterized membrane protein
VPILGTATASHEAILGPGGGAGVVAVGRASHPAGRIAARGTGYAVRMASGRRQALDATTASPPRAPALIMGLGLGGFIDGIVLHQILQWHHMLTDTGDHPSNTVAGLEANTLADGFFHLATWVLVATATALTVRAWQRRELAPPWRGHVGMLLAGWGVFNVVEGLVDHQLLGIHHVRDDLGAPLGWDLAFLAFGLLLILAGAALARSGDRAVREVRAASSAPVGPGAG